MSAREAQQPFRAVIADMDGVLTDTAGLHEKAWKRVFDDMLGARDGHQPPFSSRDYRAHVDGKPRSQGIVDFLASRGIELPEGQPDDDPRRATVCGLGNRKNQLFLELLDAEGARVYDDAAFALERWRRGQLKLAAISASKNARRILDATGLARHFDVIVDGRTAADRGLGDKRGILVEAARRLQIEPAAAVVFEDASAGIGAARSAGFGMTVGVARDRNDSELRDCGADMVVGRVDQARFFRELPNALERSAELAQLPGQRRLAVFLDYDGTLTSITQDPTDAVLSEPMRRSIEELARRIPVAIISGRDRRDVQARVAIDGLLCAGNHGFDIAGGGHQKTLPGADDVIPQVDRAERELRREVGDVPGVIIERKRFSVAAHYRQADTEAVRRAIERCADSLVANTGLRRREGKKVIELEPDMDWDKGRALRWVQTELGDPAAEPLFVIYVGDDETDEDAFAALQGLGAGIRVGERACSSLADYQIDDPEQVRQLLSSLIDRS